MEKFEIPLLDNFYDDVPFLTAEKWAEQDTELQRAIEIVKGMNIKTAILCWRDATGKMASVLSKCDHIMSSTTGDLYVYESRLLIYALNVGAPIAVAVVEEVRIMGVDTFIAFGSCGGIVPNFDESNVLVVERAIRDEGTSYHYLAPSKYVLTHAKLTASLAEFFKNKGVQYIEGITWTTDAFYRETKKRIAKRISQGAVAVEMECSALASVCKFYDLRFCQFLFFADTVKQESWGRVGDHDERRGIKVQMLELAIEFALNI